MLEAATVRSATRQAAEYGHARVVHALDAELVEALLQEALVLNFAPMEPVVGRVRQGGAVATVGPNDAGLPVLGSLSQVVTEGVRSSGVIGAGCFSANEVMYQRYRTADGGISAHRDQSFYRAAVVVFTLQGRAPFAILDPGTDTVRKEWITEPGDMCLLAGGGLTDRDRRPRHRVGPPIGSTRISLTIRMEDKGSGSFTT